MTKGSQPTDGGNLLLSDEEKLALIKLEPNSKKYIKKFLSAREYLHNIPRWCLWLKSASPKELKEMPNVLERVNKVRMMRQSSKKQATRTWADFPTLFTEDRQPESNYIIIPRHSSENRKYIPFGFFDKDNIVADSCSYVPEATLYHFGIMTSKMHMSWVKAVCGRLESRFRYSNKIVYNNYPWPKDLCEKAVSAVERAAQGVLDGRGKHPESSLADMYDPLTMPPGLVKAHAVLDKAVDKCYRGKGFESEMERLEYLFGLYNEYTRPLIKEEKKKRRKGKSGLSSKR